MDDANMNFDPASVAAEKNLATANEAGVAEAFRENESASHELSNELNHDTSGTFSDVESLPAQATQKDDEEGSHAQDDETPETESSLDYTQFVRDFMKNNNLEVLFNGTLNCTSRLHTVTSPDDIEDFLSQPDMSGLWFIDELMTSLAARAIKARQRDVERAVRKVTREDCVARKVTVAFPLFRKLSVAEYALATQAWQELTNAVFDTEASVAGACLQHFIWQVKQKLLERPVKNHLMPVIWSAIQGSGKSTFVTRFLSPLKELACKGVLLSDFTDKRSADLFRFPALVIDDMEQCINSSIPVLKSVMTGDVLTRRKSHTSMTVNVPQQTTVIGTANSPVSELIPDESGHRRFVGLAFRNGAAVKGGHADVWSAVDRPDYELLWRSVDALSPSPLDAHLGPLAELQAAERPRSVLESWLGTLDVDTEDFDQYVTQGKVSSSNLHKLYCDQTEDKMTMTAFGRELPKYVHNPAVPFGPKVKCNGAYMYPLKPRKLG